MMRFVAAAALAAGTTAAAAQTPAEQIEAGRRAYTSFCARCHGINLVVTSSAYFDLRTFPGDDKPRFVRSVVEGKRAMPAWGGIVKPEQIEAIWAYVGSVNGWPAAPQ
ncbi:MAG: cytochrome c [Burkholderiales bacterium]|nr:cytochrome c [Burkholderiales bacterium]